MNEIMQYVSIWGWQIMAIKFLIGSFISFALPRTLITQSVYVAFFLLFIACQFMSLKRKKELQNNIELEGN